MLDIGALALRLEAVGGADVVRDLRGVDAAAEKTGQKLDMTAKKSGTLGAAMKGLRSEVAFLAAGLASAALAATLQASFEAADAFEAALRRLQGTSKLTGAPMLQLQGLVDQARQQFKLATPEAAGFASEIAKLGAKAGDLTKSGSALRSILDLGAARGMDPATTMERLRAAINGSDEAIEKFFAKNPSMLWAEYARSIGTTAGKLTDQQKATALLDAFLKDGAKVRGEYSEWLGSVEGKAVAAATAGDELAASFGRSLSGLRGLGSDVKTFVFTGLRELLEGFQMAALEIGSFFRKLPLWARLAFAESGHAIATGLDDLTGSLRARGIYVPGFVTGGIRRGATAARAGADAARRALDAENEHVGRAAHEILTGSPLANGGFVRTRASNRGGGGGSTPESRARAALAADPTMGRIADPRGTRYGAGLFEGDAGGMLREAFRDSVALDDKDVSATLGQALTDIADGPILRELESFKERVSDNVATTLVDAFAGGIARAVQTGSLGEGFKALAAGFLSGFGGVLIEIGKKAVMASAIMMKIKAAIAAFAPAAGLVAGLGLIALGAAMQGGAGLIGGRSGASVGTGGGSYSAGSAGGLPTLVDRGIIGAPSATIADGLERVASGAPGVGSLGSVRPTSAVQSNHYTVWAIGNDPAAWREIQEKLNRNARRG